MRGYTLEEAWDLMWSDKAAARVIRQHHCLWEEFVAEVGRRSQYRGRVVLEWLGY